VKDYYKTLELCDHVYRIYTNEEGTFSELIVGQNKAVLIDTGYGIGDLPAAVHAVTPLPLTILITHSHCDHIGGNGLFHQPIHMGEEDIPNCTYTNNAWFRQNMNERIKVKPEGFDEKEYLSRGFGVLVSCNEGDVFDLGGMTVRVYNAPGHSVGSRAYMLEEKGFLYTGDNIGPSTLLYGFGSANRSTYIASIDKILALPFTRIYGAHMDRPMTREDLLLYRRAAVEADYSKGIPVPNPIKDGADARICCIDGMTPEDHNKPGYAAIVISAKN